MGWSVLPQGRHVGGGCKRAAEIGCTGIVLSNHGGRQLDGSRAAFDQLAEIVDAVGDRIDVMMDGGVQRGTHVLKALSLGAKAVGVGRYYLFPLAAAGQPGVERALGLMRAEIERGMKLMGCSSIEPALTQQSAVQVTTRCSLSPSYEFPGYRDWARKAMIFALSSLDARPPYGFMLLPGMTSSGFAMKRSSFSSSQTKSASFIALE